MDRAEKKLTQPSSDICPVSGLAVTRRPEWTDVDLGNGYRATFEFIGDRILLSRSTGWKHANRQAIKNLFQERRKVLGRMLDRSESFVELRDYSHFSGISSKTSRDQFIKEMEKDRDRIIAFIGFNAPRAVKIGFNVWGRLFRAPFLVSIEKDYAAALEKATAASRDHVRVTARPERKVVKFPQDTYESGGYRLEFEIIDERIVHTMSTGPYDSPVVGPGVENLRRVCKHVRPHRQDCYYINGVEGISRASRAARMRYLEEIRRWQADFPHFKMIIFYGVNRWVKAGIHLAKHRVPFRVKIVDDLESALAYIKVLDSTRHHKSETPGKNTPAPVPPHPAYPGQPHEILEFLGSISWGSGTPGIPEVSPEADPSFRPVYDAIALIKMDLDELEKNRRRAEDARQILATAIEQSTDGITIADDTGKILYVNPAFTRITGYCRQDAANRPITFITKDRESIAELNSLWQDITLNRSASRRITCHKKDGTPYMADTTISQIISSDGEKRNFVSVQRDVTHEAHLEAQLKQIHKMEAIGTLAGGIAHDFNNILFPIIGYTEMSLDEAEPGSQLAQNLREILQAATRAKQLVKQILTFSKQDSSTRKPIDLVPVIKEAVSLLRASIPATVEIKQTYQKKIGRVLADPTQIHQVMINLGSNAFHAMRKKGGLMTISLNEMAAGDGKEDVPGLPAGDYLKLSVTDTGHGMAPEISERIFDPFFTTKEMATNTGMGLSMIHGIVTGHDGRIMVNSKPGRGTTFDIYLPEIKIHPGGEISEAGGPTDELQTGRGHVLIVDDEIQSAKIMQKIVSMLGYETTRFTDSRKALSHFRERYKMVDLVITDLVMPLLTGDVLAEKLRAIKPELPVIICTGHREMINNTDTTEIREILFKPVSRSDLARAVQRALAGTRKGG